MAASKTRRGARGEKKEPAFKSYRCAWCGATFSTAPLLEEHAMICRKGEAPDYGTTGEPALERDVERGVTGAEGRDVVTDTRPGDTFRQDDTRVH